MTNRAGSYLRARRSGVYAWVANYLRFARLASAKITPLKCVFTLDHTGCDFWLSGPRDEPHRRAHTQCEISRFAVREEYFARGLTRASLISDVTGVAETFGNSMSETSASTVEPAEDILL